MPHRLIKYADIDYQMISLNAASVTTLVVTYVTENLTGVGGFILILSIAFLNVAKGISTLKNGNKKPKK